jgi:hypothetical protein
MGEQQHGQFVSSGSIVTSTRGKWAGRATLLALRPCSRRMFFVVSGFVRGNGLLDVLQGQQQLFGIELLRTPAEVGTLQLPQQVAQPIVLQERLVALGDRIVTLGSRRRKQRMQGFDINGRLRCDLAHAQH